MHPIYSTTKNPNKLKRTAKAWIVAKYNTAKLFSSVAKDNPQTWNATIKYEKLKISSDDKMFSQV